MRCRPARSTHAHPGAPDSITGETDSAASSSAECAELSAAGDRWTTIRSEEIARACAIVIPGRIPCSRARSETASSSACGARLFADCQHLVRERGIRAHESRNRKICDHDARDTSHRNTVFTASCLRKFEPEILCRRNADAPRMDLELDRPAREREHAAPSRPSCCARPSRRLRGRRTLPVSRERAG